MTFPITINSIEDARRINEFAANYDGKSEIHSSLVFIDARSLLGLIALIGKQDLRLVFGDHSDPNKVMTALEKSGLI